MRLRSCLAPCLLAAVGFGGLAGCPDRSVAKLPPVQAGEIGKDIPITAEVDLLFVIDDSRSTEDKQAVFAENFPRFIQALEAFEGGLPNLHIGVVSTSVDLGVTNIGGCPSPSPDDNGLLHNKQFTLGCPAPSDRYIIDEALPGGGRRRNYPGALDQTLACIAQIRAVGCGFEAPLEAMKRALDGTRPENAGFLRKNAFLVVVFLVDEDDASIGSAAFFQGGAPSSDFRAQPLEAYQCDQPISPTGPGSYTNCRVRTDSTLKDPAVFHEFLSTLKPPGRTIVALIGGDPQADIATGQLVLQSNGGPTTQELALLPSCTATINGREAAGRPANRLMDFVSRFGDRGLFRTICQPDYSQTLADIGALIHTAISPCLEGVVGTADVDADNPGDQIECNVSDLAEDGTETLIPRCEMQDATTPLPGDARPCWWTRVNRAACETTVTGLELNVERASPPAAGTSVRVRCATTGD